MKYLCATFLLFVGGLSFGTAMNMYKYGYGINDGFWRVICAIDEGTIWAPDFNEENFSKIKVGMSGNEVLSIMGKPLNLDEECEDGCFWLYSKQDSGTSDFDQRWVIFNGDMRVVEIRKSFFID